MSHTLSSLQYLNNDNKCHNMCVVWLHSTLAHLLWFPWTIFFLLSWLATRKTSLHCFLWANALSQFGGGLGVQRRFLSVCRQMSVFLSACGGCTSGSMTGLRCESRAARWVAVLSRKTVWTYGTCRSEWRVWFETYHGALVIVLRSLDWYRWMRAMLDVEAHQHSPDM